jgi:predicted DNA binding CopG/RHH family protein
MGDSHPKTTHKPRQIVGFSLSPEMARAIKQEAARRGLSLRRLFEELWAQYKAKSKKPK